LFNLDNQLLLSLKKLKFISAIVLSEISAGHSTAQAPVKVQLPKPSFCIWAVTSGDRLMTGLTRIIKADYPD
jgi:hypothetical protein